MKKKFVLPKISIPSSKAIDQRWIIKYSVIVRSKKITRRVAISHSKFPNSKQKKIEADRIIADITYQLQAGTHPDLQEKKKLKEDYTLIDAIDKIWIDWKCGLSERSIDDYNIMNRQFVTWLVKNGYKDLKVIEFDSEMMLDYSDYIKSKINKQTGKLLSNVTVNKYLTHQSTLFKKLKRRNFCQKNYFKDTERFRIKRKRLFYIEKDVRERMFVYLKNKDIELYRFCVCIYYLLCRPIELLSVQIKDVSLKNQNITFYAEHVKNDLTKIVRIPNVMMSLFLEMNLDQYPTNFYLFGKKLLRTQKKEKYSKRVSERFGKHRVGMQIDNGTIMYHLKHTGSQDYVEFGANPIDVMRQAGISDHVMVSHYLEMAKAKEPGTSLVKNAMPLITESKLKSLSNVEKLLSDFENLGSMEKKIFLEKINYQL